MWGSSAAASVMRRSLASVSEELPAQRGGAKALLLTILGEFVLPAGGGVWTSSLVSAAGALDIGEKNARQAIARIGDQGLIESSRHGRRVRWTLADAGRQLLESGTERIYAFGNTTVDWQGEWLVAHCPVAESQRAVRNQLRTSLGFLGFGELAPSLLVSPHVDREPRLREVLDDLGLTAESIVLRSTTGSADDDADLVKRAWDLSALADSYATFSDEHRGRHPLGGEALFRATVEMVHDWRRFPFTDPELPSRLLPRAWVGVEAAETFHKRHADWSPGARRWFEELESGP